MDVFGWITLVFIIITVILVVGDSLALLFRDLKNALADRVLTPEELAIIEADANLVAKAILKLVRLFRDI